VLALRPPFPLGEPTSADAGSGIWVGGLDLEQLDPREDVRLEDCLHLERARMLVWADDRVRGFVEVPVRGGIASGRELLAAASALPPAPSSSPVQALPVSVVVCTRDRPDDLWACLTALLAMDERAQEVIVVDNASRTSATRTVVESFRAPQVRYVREDRPGLARARNTGVRAAEHDVIAFTDDDVVVDRRWLDGLRRGFGRAANVGCVTGMVPSGQLASRSQRYFDGRVTWARSTTSKVFELAHPPVDMPLFPFRFGAYGTGANFAARRSLLFDVGGFDEALGVGSPTGGGEDIDLFVRVVLGGHALVYEPDAVVWHRHRADDAALSKQLADYGLGFGAVVTKLALDRTTRGAVLARVPSAVRHLPRMVRVADSDRLGPGLARIELRAMLRGPWALVRARRDAPARPLQLPDGEPPGRRH
jgi:GT2 family glycosyltransferase